MKYFINSIEVDEEEFYAELNAEIHADFDENFNQILTEYSDNYENEIRIGTRGFTVVGLFDFLPERIQKEITSELYAWYQDYLYEYLESFNNFTLSVNNENFLFEIKKDYEE